MSLNVNWQNPYGDRAGRWYKGNLHAHTSDASPCGQVRTERVLELYRGKGYKFLSISDHMALSEPRERGMVLIPGLEWNSPHGEHTGIYSVDCKLLGVLPDMADHDRLLRRVSRRNALAILNHPNWQPISHYRREQLEQKQSYDGIEIYNAVIERLQGYAIATDKWDYLLAKDRRILGFASDDSHLEEDIGLAWISVRAKRLTPQRVMDALRRGNFYCSSGVTLTDIGREGASVWVRSKDAEEIQAIGDGGRRLARVRGRNMRFDMGRMGSGYVRFAAYGYGSGMAWTQPFFA